MKGLANTFAIRQPVAIWSMGSDGAFTPNAKANSEATVAGKTIKNHDNIVSWAE
tara:strand:- start:2119 stop:2280 length:162 start_codon:yes stop_codon:yes gene_type:complete